MPSYGPRMTETQRWQVVAYVRSLARAGGAAAAATPAPGTPGSTGTTSAAPAPAQGATAT
jgi:hypothetical protein